MRSFPDPWLTPVATCLAGCLAVAVYQLVVPNYQKENDASEDEESEEKTKRLTLHDEMELDESLTVKPIGVIHSIYRLCVGTPRQGLLAPHARGRIELTLPSDMAADTVDGLEHYSHIWILFCFHLNTVGQRVPTKIAPPALGGAKVGIFASRSPHRCNPIGITLAKLERIQVAQRHSHGRKPKPVVCLHISGLDLVEGTPVLDIKPYVPAYDAPLDGHCNLPPWVSYGLATRRDVVVTDRAREELRCILEDNNNALDFYAGRYDESVQDGLENVLSCIEEVLAIDVRSQWQTKKARQGKSQAERAKRLQLISLKEEEQQATTDCTQQIDNLLIRYIVAEATVTERKESQGSGAEDIVTITSIRLLEKTGA